MDSMVVALTTGLASGVGAIAGVFGTVYKYRTRKAELTQEATQALFGYLQGNIARLDSKVAELNLRLDEQDNLVVRLRHALGRAIEALRAWSRWESSGRQGPPPETPDFAEDDLQA